jgi:valyl-tRNA synthetase
LNKLLNVSKFVMMFDRPEKKPKLTALDNLFVNYIEGLTRDIDEHYEKYDFYNPAQKLRTFLWEIFASNYVELVKSRAYNQENKFSEAESESARWSLHYILERFLHLVYPIIPQISTTIATKKGIDLLTAKWPKIEGKPNFKNDREVVGSILEFNSMVWKEKKEKEISLRDEIGGIEIPKELSAFESDLNVCHGLK